MKVSKTPGHFNFAERQAQKSSSKGERPGTPSKWGDFCDGFQIDSMLFRKDQIEFMRDKDGKMRWLAPIVLNGNKGHEE